MLIFSVPDRDFPLLIVLVAACLALFGFDAYFYAELFLSPDVRVLLVVVAIGIVWYWMTGE